MDTEYGSARWATVRDLAWSGQLYADSGFVVGRVADAGRIGPKFALKALSEYPAHLDEQVVRISQAIWYKAIQRAMILLPEHEIIHAAIYGRSGAGKSKSHAIPNLLLDPSSAIVVDVKGELAAETAWHRAKAFGHEIICIAPFGGVPEGLQNHAFNPLSVVNLRSPHLVPDAIHFARALIRPEKTDHSPFFTKSAILILDALLAFFFCHLQPSDCTLLKLLQMLLDPEKLQTAADLMLQSNMAGGHLKLKGLQVKNLTGKTLMDVIATAATQLHWIASAEIEHATNWTTFPLQKLLDGRATIYLIFPMDRVDDYGGLIRIWITALAHAIFAEGLNPHRSIRFYFDEASLLGQDMPVLEKILTKGRGYGLKSNWYYQSVLQIAENFPEHMVQVFREQMSLEQFLEVSTAQAANEISQWIGQTTIRVWNESFTSGWSDSSTFGMHPSSTSGSNSSTTRSYQKTARALIRPEELLQLPRDMTVILKPGCPPILARKVKSYLAQDWAELTALATGQSYDLNCHRTFRRVITAVVLLALFGWGLTHPKEVDRIKGDVIAAWNKQSSPHRSTQASMDMHSADDKPKSKNSKSRKPPRRRQRMPQGYYPYGY